MACKGLHRLSAEGEWPSMGLHSYPRCVNDIFGVVSVLVFICFLHIFLRGGHGREFKTTSLYSAKWQKKSSNPPNPASKSWNYRCEPPFLEAHQDKEETAVQTLLSDGLLNPNVQISQLTYQLVEF